MDTGVQEVEKEKEIKALYDKIDTLNSILWENRALQPSIKEWLKNFETDEEKEEALYLLSNCMYFSNSSIRAILRALYRDKYRAPIIQQIRKDRDDTLDDSIINAAFQERLLKTRFLGVGNPSESGVHLLYYFRQENKIPRNLFIHTDDLLSHTEPAKLSDKCKDVEHVVFIDDLCGSGSQATRDTNVKRCVEKLRAMDKCPKISYLMLFGTLDGIKVVRAARLNEKGPKLFDEVEAVMELNDTYKCFGKESRYFKKKSKEFKEKTRLMSYKYGIKLIDKIIDRDYSRKLGKKERQEKIEHRSLGYGDCQLLLALHHNTPNNTLPIIWFDEDDETWTPIFKRYNKVYR